MVIIIGVVDARQQGPIAVPRWFCPVESRPGLRNNVAATGYSGNHIFGER